MVTTTAIAPRSSRPPRLSEDVNLLWSTASHVMPQCPGSSEQLIGLAEEERRDRQAQDLRRADGPLWAEGPGTRPAPGIPPAGSAAR
jgi:hypothetical protein